MEPVEELNSMIASLNQLIEQLTNRTPPKEVGFLINARGIIRDLRDDWEHGCGREHVREQVVLTPWWPSTVGRDDAAAVDPLVC